ncbi:MAG: DUF3576 domain-containing protein [Alphaproteobacteria bacterium]|nr:DUF3576 domain-containing protein [Alphaproteobacteria bacterium]
MRFPRLRAKPLLVFGLLVALMLPLAACEDGNLRTPGNDEYYDDSRRARVRGRLTGQDGILIFGTDRSRRDDGAGSGIGVNAFLWRASLDTISFMPLSSADPFGGVIISDWYAPPAAPGERFKLTVYILGRQLRSDGLRVAVFRQIAQGGVWMDAPTSQGMAGEIEDKILARARELRIQSGDVRSASR